MKGNIKHDMSKHDLSKHEGITSGFFFNTVLAFSLICFVIIYPCIYPAVAVKFCGQILRLITEPGFMLKIKKLNNGHAANAYCVILMSS